MTKTEAEIKRGINGMMLEDMLDTERKIIRCEVKGTKYDTKEYVESIMSRFNRDSETLIDGNCYAVRECMKANLLMSWREGSYAVKKIIQTMIRTEPFRIKLDKE
jgi:hypothetical protein